MIGAACFWNLGAGGAGGLPKLVAVDGTGAPSGVAADGAFRTRPSLLIFSEMLMVGALSMAGVASRELADGSFLTVVAEAFFAVIFEVEFLEEVVVEAGRTRISIVSEKRRGRK